MAGIKKTHDEDGRQYVSQVVGESKCAYCGNPIVIRSEGRPAKFCSPTCRAGAHRGSRPSRQTRVNGG